MLDSRQLRAAAVCLASTNIYSTAVCMLVRASCGGNEHKRDNKLHQGPNRAGVEDRYVPHAGVVKVKAALGAAPLLGRGASCRDVEGRLRMTEVIDVCNIMYRTAGMHHTPSSMIMHVLSLRGTRRPLRVMPIQGIPMQGGSAGGHQSKEKAGLTRHQGEWFTCSLPLEHVPFHSAGPDNSP